MAKVQWDHRICGPLVQLLTGLMGRQTYFWLCWGFDATDWSEVRRRRVGLGQPQLLVATVLIVHLRTETWSDSEKISQLFSLFLDNRKAILELLHADNIYSFDYTSGRDWKPNQSTCKSQVGFEPGSTEVKETTEPTGPNMTRKVKVCLNHLLAWAVQPQPQVQ